MPPNQNCFCYWGRDCVTLICVIELRTLNTQSICSPQCVCSRAELSLFFSSDLHYWPLVSEREGEREGWRGREREGDVGEITEAVTVRMRLSVRAVECANRCSQVSRRTQKHSEKDLIDFPTNTHTDNLQMNQGTITEGRPRTIMLPMKITMWESTLMHDNTNFSAFLLDVNKDKDELGDKLYSYFCTRHLPVSFARRRW